MRRGYAPEMFLRDCLISGHSLPMALDLLTDYYSRRAPEYEEIYHRSDPVRQAEQQIIANEVRRLVQDRRVLEIACGTGYWTQFAAETAAHVCGIDSSPE